MIEVKRVSVDDQKKQVVTIVQSRQEVIEKVQQTFNNIFSEIDAVTEADIEEFCIAFVPRACDCNLCKTLKKLFSLNSYERKVACLLYKTEVSIRDTTDVMMQRHALIKKDTLEEILASLVGGRLSYEDVGKIAVIIKPDFKVYYRPCDNTESQKVEISSTIH